MVNNAGTLSAEPLLASPIDHAANAVQRSLFLTERTATVSAVMTSVRVNPRRKIRRRMAPAVRGIADLTELATDPQGATFTHEVGLNPTKDARIAEAHVDLQPSILH